VEHAETVQPRHLNVEQEQVNGQPLQHFDRLDAVATLRDDLDVVTASEEDPNRRAGVRLVVDNRNAQYYSVDLALLESQRGSRSVARTPAAALANSSRPAGFRVCRRSLTFFRPYPLARSTANACESGGPSL
jgi:hypothetical protein